MTTTASLAPGRPQSLWHSETVILHLYGHRDRRDPLIAALYSPRFHRDELATLDDARHFA